jgi:hypothetical protein
MASKIDKNQWIAISVIGAVVGIVVNSMYNHIKTTVTNNKLNGSVSPTMTKINNL